MPLPVTRLERTILIILASIIVVGLVGVAVL